MTRVQDHPLGLLFTGSPLPVPERLPQGPPWPLTARLGSALDGTGIVEGRQGTVRWQSLFYWLFPARLGREAILEASMSSYCHTLMIPLAHPSLYLFFGGSMVTGSR